MDSLNVLLIGKGSAGSRHYASLRADGCDVAVADPQCEPDGSRRFATDADAARSFAPEAVVIATPADQHLAQLARWAFDQGLPTFVEKPLFTTADWSREGEPVVHVGYQLRFHDAAIAFRDAVKNGVAGAPMSARFYVGQDMRLWPGRGYADALLECSHELDAARWVLGDGTLAGAARVGETWEMLLRHDSGCVTTAHLSGDQVMTRRFWEVVGTRGFVRWSWDDDEVASGSSLQETHVLWRGNARECNEHAYRAEIREFLRCARARDRQTACTLADGLAVLRWCDEARAMAGEA